MTFRLSQLMASHGANALSIGIQIVLIVWLAADTLSATPFQLALVQASALLPNLVMLPLAGVVCDRFKPTQVLLLSNVMLFCLHLIMLSILEFAQLHLLHLLVYAASLGCCNSFIQSGREKLVARFPVNRLHRRISMSGMANQGAQALGILLAGLGDQISWAWLIALQATLCLAAGVSYASLHSFVPNDSPPHQPFWPSLKEGFKWVWFYRPVRHTVVIVAFNGAMQMGMLMVLLPVIARDLMNFQALEFSLLQLSFALGGIVVQWVILRRKPQTRHPGQGILFSLMYAGMLALAMSYGPTPMGLFALIFLWGCVSGVSANLARLVVQTVIPQSHCGRAMSVYQLALFGFAPLGALLAGWCLSHLSLSQTFQFIAFSCFALFGASLLTRPLWQISVSEQPSSE